MTFELFTAHSLNRCKISKPFFSPSHFEIRKGTVPITHCPVVQLKDERDLHKHTLLL